MYPTLSFGVMHKILQLKILVELLDFGYLIGGNCTASVWYSYMVHIIFKLKVQKYFGTLLENHEKVLCSGSKTKICEWDLADKCYLNLFRQNSKFRSGRARPSQKKSAGPRPTQFPTFCHL